jgi:hypothetical protein
MTIDPDEWFIFLKFEKIVMSGTEFYTVDPMPLMTLRERPGKNTL